MNNRILKNLSYNLLLQVVLMVLPLVSIPYVSRVLGAEGIGTYSYTLSLAQYFIIFGTLGLSLYGNRQIAYVKDDRLLLSSTFWSIFIIRLISTVVSLVFYYALFSFSTALKPFHYLQSIHIIAAIFDITWLFVGLEDFKRIVSRNLVIKVLGLLAVFVFVKTSNDVYLYTIINVAISVLSSAVMWIYIPKILEHVKVSPKDVLSHVKPALHLFVPQLASQVYLLLDKSMLGWLSNLEQVGFYTQGERIIRAILELTSSLGVVMLPRMSHIYATGDHELMRRFLNQNLNLVSMIAFPIIFGVIALTPTFVPLFFGEGYLSVVLLMSSMSSIILFISLSSVLGVQYLLPQNRVQTFTYSIVTGALVNLTINFSLIPVYGAFGAVLGTILAEFSVMMVQLYALRREIEIKKFIIHLFKYSFASILMFILIIWFRFSLTGIQLMLVQVPTGIIIYGLILHYMKDEMFVLVENRVKSILKI